MATDKVTKCLGLVTQYSPLTVVPGALSKANDCLNRRENIIEDRRGYKLYSDFSTSPSQLLAYQNKVIVHSGTTLNYDNGSGTFAAYSGSYSAVSGNRIRGFEANSNLYITTSLGVKVLTDVAGTAARSAGAPRALDPSYTLTGSSGFLSNNYQCAYRAVIQITDANSNVLTGYPSQRLWVVNAAGGSRNVILTMYLPSSCVAGNVVQFYRAIQVSGTSSDTAGDEMALIYQYQLTSSDISNGYVTFTDSTTDSLMGASLYTSPSQQGISQANAVPPLCKDLTIYKANYMLFANTQTKQRLTFTMVGAGTLSGKTITLAGVTYNFGGSEIVSGGGAPQALVSSTGVVSVDIDATARSLIRVINRYASNTSVYAYYLSGPTDLPGQIMIEERGVGGSAFTLQCSDSGIQGMFFPQPPVSPSTTTQSTSTNQVQKNAVYYSKYQQLEAVPLLNYVLVGSSNKEILRIVSLRDSAIIIKEDGVFRITGESPSNFIVAPVDTTVFCKAMNSVVVLQNQVLMLSNQGVVAISESGVQVLSRDIEPNLIPLLQNSSLSTYTSATGYESERSYFISTITQIADTSANQVLIYNLYTKTWVRHTYGFTCAIVESGADKIYFAKPTATPVYVERKTFTDADYADPETAITITALGATTVDFTISGATPDIGWVIAQGTSEVAIASIISLSGGFRATLETAVPSDWSTASATIYPPVGMDVEWQPWTMQAPEMLKQVYLAAVLGDDSLNDGSASLVTPKFRSNFNPEFKEVDILQPKAGWGSAWGSTPWGGGGDPVGYPTYVPQEMQYCTRLTIGVKHKYARQKLVCAGFAVAFNVASERIGRG